MGDITGTAQDGVLVLRLVNGKANALTSAMAAQLIAMLSDIPDDIGAVLVTGTAGGAFCAGSDIRELARLQDTPDGPASMLRIESRALRALAGLPLPTIAAIDGIAFGGGMELAAACDIVLAGDQARFCLPEVKLGVFPGIGGTVWIPRRIGHVRALEMMLTGQEIDAATAHRWNFVNRLAGAASAEADALDLARALAAGPRGAVAMIKRSLRDALALPEDEALDAALDRAVSLGHAPESREGLRAFLAREAPDFASARRRPADETR
ncbi:enoyl-CoA hydratase/isomerase family protein [Aquibium carbonis]|uniref:Enoyl-CoA hydratase/isomerase family protein n=1 Tax=Aquibium carbonis TaxID=2495581 RepID=A0A429YUK0_9HYPH|nr:enoyl-CoA hydratase-related protein [Aquibium carbonis]RST85014.1 enoyl-CoA hydratase/isomerase family protein [Aquibium carbonis]